MVCPIVPEIFGVRIHNIPIFQADKGTLSVSGISLSRFKKQNLLAYFFHIYTSTLRYLRRHAQCTPVGLGASIMDCLRKATSLVGGHQTILMLNAHHLVILDKAQYGNHVSPILLSVAVSYGTEDPGAVQ